MSGEKLYEALAPEIVRRRARGESYSVIGRALDCSRATIGRALHHAGVTTDGESSANAREEPSPENSAGGVSSADTTDDPASRPVPAEPTQGPIAWGVKLL